jgi:hypothetical protein
MEDKDFYWLVGLLEGEGSFSFNEKGNLPYVSINMTDEDIIIKVQELMGSSNVYRNDRHPERGWKPSYQTVLRGKKAVTLMNKLHPFMGIRRREQIDTVLSKYDPDKRHKSNMSKKSLSNEKEIEIYEKYSSGNFTIRELAEEYGVHWKTIMRTRKRLEGTYTVGY